MVYRNEDVRARHEARMAQHRKRQRRETVAAGGAVVGGGCLLLLINLALYLGFIAAAVWVGVTVFQWATGS